jgi:hypothetical protein
MTWRKSTAHGGMSKSAVSSLMGELNERLVFLLIEGGAPGALKQSLSPGTTFRLAPRRRTLNGRLPPPRDSILIND